VSARAKKHHPEASGEATDDPKSDFSAGLADYHDPTAGFGGGTPAYSALTLRLALAIFGAVLCGGAAVVIALTTHHVGFTVVFAVLAVIAVVDVAVILRRKRRGEPG